jgi:hypothetical protein
MRGPRITARFGAFPRGRFIRNCFYGRCGLYPAWGWYYPGWYGDLGWYDSDYDYDSYPAANYATADYGAATVQVEQQQQAEIDRLNREVAELRETQEPARAPSQRPASEIESQPTEFVFRDGHTADIDNYAIMGDSLWVLASGRSKKIPLSTVDLAATKKANDEHGVEFRTPR